MRRMFVRELGLVGMAMMVYKLLRDLAVARGMIEWDRLLKKGEGIFGYGYFVARRPQGME